MSQIDRCPLHVELDVHAATQRPFDVSQACPVPQLALETQATQRSAELQWGVAPPHWLSLMHSTQVWMDVSHTRLFPQLVVDRHCTQ